MLARLRMSPIKIRAAIVECDDESLSADDLSTLSRTLPSSDEVIKLFAPDIDPTKLAKSDAFLREISTIPRLKERLETMVFRQRFDMHMAEVMPDLAILRGAAMELRESERFRDVLRVVRGLGNRLNSGSFRGGARGFKLDALVKVSLWSWDFGIMKQRE